MKPTRVVARRAHSPIVLHKDVTLTTCVMPVTMRLAPYHGFAGCLQYRCETCDEQRLADHQVAPALQLWPVLPDVQPEYQEDDGDVDDFREGWMG